jgi:hypothetical protein
MSFTEQQNKALTAKLNAKHVRTRDQKGKTLSYLEGWYVIAEANRIFGFDAWDRETVATQCVWKGTKQGREGCAYIARVRIRVRVGDVVVSREGHGSGHGWAVLPGEAHESAIKEAETDATKRALATFGNPFGLALYDKEKRGVRGAVVAAADNARGAGSWVILSSDGDISSVHEDPVAYFSCVRKQLEAIESADELTAFWGRNSVTIEMLKRGVPDLKNTKGEHYGVILESLLKARILETGSKNGNGHGAPRSKARNRSGDGVDKALLAIAAPRRVRDKEHLKYVAQQACMVCGRRPGQAHHIRFIQLRALGSKPSDEWVVSLCATHHRSLHQVGDEEGWWSQLNLDPLIEAQRLWQVTRIEQGEEEAEQWRPSSLA